MFMRIENWSLIERGPGFALQGQVKNHPRLGDTPEGLVTKTSVLMRFDADTNSVVTHSGSHYRLGDPDPRYEAMFPGSRDRLIRALKVSQPVMGAFARN